MLLLATINEIIFLQQGHSRRGAQKDLLYGIALADIRFTTLENPFR